MQIYFNNKIVKGEIKFINKYLLIAKTTINNTIVSILLSIDDYNKIWRLV